MPTYIYECENCKAVFEKMQGIKDSKLLHCDRCHTDSLFRHIGNPDVLPPDFLKYKDSRGTPIWFKEPYYDRALNRKFYSKKEKWEYMKKNNIHMDGSYDKRSRNRNPTASATREYEPIYSRHRITK